MQAISRCDVERICRLTACQHFARPPAGRGRRARYEPVADFPQRWLFPARESARNERIVVLLLLHRSGLHRGRPRLLCPLLTSTPRSPASLHAQSGRPDTTWTSRGKSNRLHRGPAGSTAPALDGRGLRCEEPARPAGSASYPVLVHRAAILLHAAFRPRLAGPGRHPCASLTLLHHQDG